MASLEKQLIGLVTALACLPLGCGRAPAESRDAHENRARPAASSDASPVLDFAVAPADASRSASGLAWKILAKADGEVQREVQREVHPGPRDRVTVRFTGWTRNEKVFDSTPPGGPPTQYWMAALIPGWVEALRLMVPGEKRRFWIPAFLAYGDQPSDPRAPAGPLVFDIELIDVTPAPEEPQVPVDVAAIPKGAKRTPSGLAYKVLKHGSGQDHPRMENTVEIHYTGWRSNGAMFDTSFKHGVPATYAVSTVNKGWIEALSSMVVGDKTRFWVPGRLIYGDKAGKLLDKGSQLFVFEIELVSIK